MWRQKTNWIHFIGIGGITTGQLAVAYLDKGYTVTGSDEGLYEPMKSFLTKHPELQVKQGFNFRNLIWQNYSGNPEDKDLIPEKIVALGGLSPKNKEILFANKAYSHHFQRPEEYPIYNFAEVFEKELIVPGKSIVVAGSFGKTTVTSILVQIFLEAGKNISYMFGGLVEGFETGVKLKDENTEYSIVEGDEFISSRTDMQSKFFHYNPSHLLLTGYAYDHTDIFKTPQEYYDNFAKLISQIPEDGLIIYNQKYPELEKLTQQAKCKVIQYNFQSETVLPENKLVGQFNQENILCAVTLARELGISEESINTGLSKYKGVKRRLEIKLESNIKINEQDYRLTAIDDFGSTPGKAKSSIDAVKNSYPGINLIVAFQPNQGSRTQAALNEFTNSKSFDQGDSILLMPYENPNNAALIDFETFANSIIANYPQKQVRKLNEELKNVLPQLLSADKQNILLFLSSGSIDEYLKQLESSIIS